MKEKIKKIMIGYLPGFITGLIICGTISVIAATYFPSNQTTYDNTASGLESTNVQDAIDELYGVCFPPSAGDQIIEDGGLEKDPYECRYFFTGANPNNYVTFNGETAGWRIISVGCDGTIKIIKNDSIGKMAWDDSDSKNWARPSSLNTYLNGTYYNGLNTTAKSQIVAHDWSTGYVPFDEINMNIQVSDENNSKWNGKMALPTLSEYIRTNSNTSSCGTNGLINKNYISCNNTGWMDTTNINYWWTLTPFEDNSTGSNGVFNVTSKGYINYDYADGGYVGYSNQVRPTLYLSSDIKITGGDGSQNNPYTLA